MREHWRTVNAPTQSFDLGYDPGEIRRRRQRVGDRVDLAANIHRDHIRAVLGQAHRVATALSPGRACNQRDLAIKPSCHTALVFLVSRVCMPP
jgi:hypothetical protein